MINNSIDVDSLSQQLQQVLKNQYTNSVFVNKVLPFNNIKDSGFRCYSQFEEDGIILYILSIIGFTNKKVVELCCGDGSECMASNLILNHGFNGYLFDGDNQNIENANLFFKNKKDCLLSLPELNQAWITRDNVNKLLINAGVTGEIDVLSMDMDGVDYYIWDAINVINPRLCVFETQDIIPSHLSLTVPYDDNFYAWNKPDPYKDFRSMSLLAMKKLCASKNYRLIGSNRHGFNCFFLRNDIAQDIFKEVDITTIHNNSWTQYGQTVRWPKVENLPWVTV